MSAIASSEDPKATAPTSRSTDLEPSVEWRARHLGLDETWHAQTQKLALTCEAFCRHSIRNRPRRSRWLVIGGNTGSGKTHVSKRILRRFRDCRMWAWEQGYWGGSIPSAAFWRWQKLAELDETEWQGALEEITGDDRMRGADLLVLDDLGSETDAFKSGRPQARLQTVLDVMERRWLLVTTNVPRKDWAGRWDKRVASRLESAASVSLFHVPDYRPQIAKR